MSGALLDTSLPLPLARRGKVRDVYDLGEAFLFVATDRISAFDVVLSPGIPTRGASSIRFPISGSRISLRSRIIFSNPTSRNFRRCAHIPNCADAASSCKKCSVIPIECVARGYLVGSGWKEYQQSGTVCGIRLEPGLKLASKLREPIFTPATKEETGHDENIAFERMAEIIGEDLAAQLRDLTLKIYRQAADYAVAPHHHRGHEIRIRLHKGRVIWIDEALTPDSSRFWPADQYAVGKNPPSFDKQFVRDWLESTGWDKNPPAPELPPDVVAKTREKYIDAFRQLTEKSRRCNAGGLAGCSACRPGGEARRLKTPASRRRAAGVTRT